LKKQSEEYANKFYSLREIIRWLYKEKNSADKAQPEIIDKLKIELELIRNSLKDSMQTRLENDFTMREYLDIHESRL